MDQKLYDLTHGIDKSIRYHQRRRGFLELVHRALMFVVILTSSAAFSTVANDHGVAKWFALASAVFAAFDLATGVGVLARDYAVLHGKFSALSAEIVRIAQPTEQQILDWTARRIEIEGEEPPIYWVVEADCDNEICLLRDKRDKVVPIPFQRRLVMHLFRQEGFNPQRPKPVAGALST